MEASCCVSVTYVDSTLQKIVCTMKKNSLYIKATSQNIGHNMKSWAQNVEQCKKSFFFPLMYICFEFYVFFFLGFNCKQACMFIVFLFCSLFPAYCLNLLTLHQDNWRYQFHREKLSFLLLIYNQSN